MKQIIWTRNYCVIYVINSFWKKELEDRENIYNPGN